MDPKNIIILDIHSSDFEMIYFAFVELAHGRRGLDWDGRARIQFGQVQTWRYQQGDPTDLLSWKKKRDVFFIDLHIKVICGIVHLKINLTHT